MTARTIILARCIAVFRRVFSAVRNHLKHCLLGPWIDLELEFRERENADLQGIGGLQRRLQRMPGVDARTLEAGWVSGWSEGQPMALSWGTFHSELALEAGCSWQSAAQGWGRKKGQRYNLPNRRSFCKQWCFRNSWPFQGFEIQYRNIQRMCIIYHYNITTSPQWLQNSLPKSERRQKISISGNVLVKLINAGLCYNLRVSNWLIIFVKVSKISIDHNIF